MAPVSEVLTGVGLMVLVTIAWMVLALVGTLLLYRRDGINLIEAFRKGMRDRAKRRSPSEGQGRGVGETLGVRLDDDGPESSSGG
jgi:hypothetical protein